MTKYNPTNFKMDCPFGFTHQKNCHTCKLSIALLTEEELETARNQGNFVAQQNAYSCVFIALLQEVKQLNKLLRNEMSHDYNVSSKRESKYP